MPEDKGSPPPRGAASMAIVSRGFELIHTKRPGGRPEFELYDHWADPLDLRDFAECRD